MVSHWNSGCQADSLWHCGYLEVIAHLGPLDLRIDTFDHGFGTVLWTATGAAMSPGQSVKMLFGMVAYAKAIQ